MTDFVIPCDTFVRLSNVLHNFHDAANEWFRTIRIDNGVAMATNRSIMAIENIGGLPGVIHVMADPALIQQCRTEAAFSSTLTITVNEVLKFAVAKTTLGYVHPGNCALWSDAPNELDRWRSIAQRTAEPVPASRGGMYWKADAIAQLASASPSGGLVFEEFIDATGRPTVIRDVNEPNWCGIFNPYQVLEEYQPATLPGWLR